MVKNIAHQHGLFHRWFFSALLLMSSAGILPATADSGPQGGQVVGGAGTIVHSGNTTTINQSSQNMAIDWQSYNLNVDERVQYIQPNTSSVSLNRILSQGGSTIAGRIDANGQVILVNPNGIFFTPTSVINVGGIIASGLDIKTSDFMNGDYIFNEVENTDGIIINGGLINAAMGGNRGGNVALIGKQVRNEGLIAANLGFVTLASGRAAYLTFDADGLIGIRITEEMLQDELGIDPAILNSGDIEAAGGRVLLTASASRNVFAQAINTDGIEIATHAVVHDDGSFTLGGADILNSGVIDTSIPAGVSTNAQYAAIDDAANVGRIILVGDNITSSGALLANSASGNGGEIELHAQDTVLLTENSLTSARSESNGQGGSVKVLGDQVGLFDQATVDVSGANGGGEVLIGGDYQGNNANIRNATTTIVNRGTTINADAIENGDGGKVIVWSDGDTFFGGGISVRGGEQGGNGGLIETSGKENLTFRGTTDRSAPQGEGGLLLLDPRDITIGSAVDDDGQLAGGIVNFGDDPSSDFSISAGALETELSAGNVTLQANRDIRIQSSITTSSSAVRTLTLQAGDDITTDNGTALNLGNDNLIMIAGSAGCNPSCQDSDPSGGVFDGGNIQLRGTIDTSGSLVLHAADSLWVDNAIGGTTAPSSIVMRAGNSIETRANAGTAGTITLSGDITFIAADSTLISDSSYPTLARSQPLTGNIILRHDVTTGNGDFTATTAAGTFNNAFTDQNFNAGAGAVTIQSEAGASLGDITADTLTVTTTAGQITQSTNAAQNLDIAGTATFDAGANAIDLQNNNNNLQGTTNLTTSANAILNNNATTTTLGTVNTGGTLTVNAQQDLTLTNTVTANSAQLNFAQNNSGGTFTAQSGATYTVGNSTITGGSDNDTFSLAADLSGTIDGALGDDTFNIDTATLSATLTGGAGNDTLTSSDDTTNPTTWTIDSADGGTLSNASGTNVTFSALENLTGGSGVDDFTLTGTTGAISGTVNGGAGNDTLTARNSANTWTLSAALNQLAETAGNIYVDTIDGIETFIGGSGIDTFNINRDMAGTLNGSSGNDQFNFDSGLNNTTFNGTLNGGNGADTFTLNATNLTLTNTLNGGAGADTLSAANEANYWTVNNTNSGTLYTDSNRTTARTAFNNIETLTGNNNLDNFLIDINGTIGEINGGSGSDTLSARDSANTWTFTATLNQLAETAGNIYVTAINGIETLIGGSNSDTYNLSTDVTSTLNGADGDDTFNLATNTLSATLAGGAGTDTVHGADATNSWNITTAGGGTLNTTTAFTQMETLSGGANSDDFLIDTNGTLITINGSGGSDTLTARDSANTWTFTAAASQLATTAGDLYVSFINNIETLIGGSSVDTYNISTNVASTLNGSAGDDTFNLTTNTLSATLAGGAGSDTVRGADATNTWNITDAGSGTLNTSATFTQMETLSGGDNSDNFLIGTNGTITTLNGGGGNDTLIARDSANTWTFTTLSNTLGDAINILYVTAINGIETLTGGSDVDTFNISSDVASTLNGSGGDDTFNLATNTLSVTLAGGAGSDTVRGADATNSWNITTNDGGTLNTTTAFTQMETLNGGNNSDNFLIGASGTITTLNGGGGNDTLTARDSANTWTLLTDTFNQLSETAGDLYITAINGIDTLIGGSGVDTFNIGRDISGTITGSAGNDTFNISAPTSGLINGGGGSDRVTITASGNQTIELGNRTNANLNLYQIETLSANTVTSNTLLSDSSAAINDWTINGANSGRLSDGTTNTTFSNIANLSGGITTDIFTLNAGATLDTLNSGAGNDTVTLNNGSTLNTVTLGDGNDQFTINGGTLANAVQGGNGNDTFTANGGSVPGFDGGADDDSVNYTSIVTIALGDSLGVPGVTLNNIEGIDAEEGSTLNARQDTTTTWIIDDNNAGRVSDAIAPAQTLTFSGFTILNGGSGTDNFTLNNNGSLNNNGRINGNSGDDTLTINLNNPARTSGQINFDGGNGNDTLNLTGSANSETWTPNTSGNDQLAYVTSNGALFNANYRNSDTVNNNIQTNSLTINSNGNNDVIELSSTTFSSATNSAPGNGNVTYSAANKPNITINATNGSDVNLIDNINLIGDLRISADQITQTDGTTLSANTLTLDNIGTETRLTTNLEQLALINATGSLYLAEQDTLTLSAMATTASSTIDIIARDDINSSAALQNSGTLTLAASNIDLSGQNQLNGPLTLTAGTNITLNNITATTLGNVSAQNFTLTSSGNITSSSGIVNVQNGTTLTTNGSIMLDNENNNFEQLTLSAAENATIVDIDNLILNRATVGNALTVSANDIQLGTLTATTLTLNATQGALVDDSSRLIADRITLTAARGIGSTSSALNTTTTNLSAINRAAASPATTEGSININNSRNVTIDDLRNSGNITLTNRGDITLSVNDPRGAIDANDNGNLNDPVYDGSVTLIGTGRNSVYTQGIGTLSGQPDITAENLIVQNFDRFGTQPSPLGLRVNNNFTLLFAQQGAVHYLGNRPRNVTTSADLALLVIRGFIGISSEQLIDLDEPLGFLDPAIFTAVKNYNYSDISILLPPDQRYDVEDEDEDEEEETTAEDEAEVAG